MARALGAVPASVCGGSIVAWAKIDDGMWSHRKVVNAGNEALGATDTGTDGATAGLAPPATAPSTSPLVVTPSPFSSRLE